MELEGEVDGLCDVTARGGPVHRHDLMGQVSGKAGKAGKAVPAIVADAYIITPDAVLPLKGKLRDDFGLEPHVVTGPASCSLDPSPLEHSGPPQWRAFFLPA